MTNKDRLIPKRSLAPRKENNREERTAIGNYDKKIVFSFKDFDDSQKVGQCYSDWQKDELLSAMLEHFGEICKWSVVEAINNGKLGVYEKFPKNSCFKEPKHIKGCVKWAAIKNIKGQKQRVIGHLIDNVFYVVFLDRDHKFYLTKQKHT